MGVSIQEIGVDRRLQHPVLSTIVDMREILTPRDLGIRIETFEDGRRLLEMDIGEGILKVSEIPGASMTEEEWTIIQFAREAYSKMWGGNSASETIKQDPFDGLESDSPYITHHYIGQVCIPGVEPRFITMRKVRFNPEAINFPTPPDDGSFWQVVNKNTGCRESLWNYIVNNGTDSINIAAISRTGTHPYRVRSATPIERDRNAIAFAGIQVLAAEKGTSDYFICQLCQEFQTDVLSIEDIYGERVMLDFARTQDTLNFPPELELGLDIQNPHVRQVKALFPGYWVDGEGTTQIINQLLALDHLSIYDLQEALLRATEEFPNIQSKADNNGLIRTLTNPLYFKYLIPLIKANRELRELLVDEVKERPFSSTLIVANWRKSAEKLLAAAKEKYQS
jgi:hypothetical protein